MINSLQGNALPVLLDRINKKLTKRYGTHTALLIRDTSFWDWELVLPAIKKHLDEQIIPFDLGIWIHAAGKSSILQIYPPKTTR